MKPSTPTKHEGDLNSFKDDLHERFFELFGTAAKLHLMKVPKGVDNDLFESSKPLLDSALSNLEELMARLGETDEPLDTKTSWWQSGHWLFG